MKIIGKNNLAKAFKVSRTTVENWCRSGCPSEFNGKEHEFELSQVVKWHEGRFLKNDKGGDTESLIKARAVIAHYKGLITELEYKTMCGELVPAKAVEETAFNKTRQVRDTLLNIPDRLAALLAAESSREKCHEMLDKEIRQALENLSNDFTEVKK